MATPKNSVYHAPVISDSIRNPLKTRRCRIKFGMTLGILSNGRFLFFWIPPRRLAAKGVPRNDDTCRRHCEERSNPGHTGHCDNLKYTLTLGVFRSTLILFACLMACSAMQAQGNNRQPATPANTPASDVTSQDTKTVEMTYAKSDFVAGDVIFFEDNVANEKLGEFPSQWDLTFGNAEVAMINGEKCIHLIGYSIIIPLMKPAENYLPDEFTIEYDLYGDISKESKIACELRLNDGGKVDMRTIERNKSRTGRQYASENPLSVFFNGSSFIGRQYFDDKKNTDMVLNANWFKPDGTSATQKETIAINPKEWQHIAISFNQRALKYYVNGIRVLNIPNMKKPVSFWLWSENGNVYLKNIRIAKGAVPLYDRMMTSGKIITYGITFDTGKSSVKPESMGEIMRFVTLMKENPELKFSVEGHTDNTGNAVSNQSLSEARAKAVADKLVENGIVRDRLTAAGKGQNAPLADNSTEEGRAKNRRVEFIKQ